MSFYKVFPYNNILVLGLGKSGTAAAGLLLNEKRHVRINDLRSKDDQELETLKAMGADIVIGSHPLSVLEGVEVIVKTPGLPYDNPVLKEAVNRSIPIMTEIELVEYLTNAPVIGITGSNGKTTTTTLIGDMFLADEQPAKVAGNIGVAATDMVSALEDDDRLVLELSSFQLAGTDTFKPDIGVFLNLYEAHLDYHKTFENYKNAKARLFANQTAGDYLVYNADQSIVRELVKQAESTCVPFSASAVETDGAWADEAFIYFQDEIIIAVDDVALVGRHNLDNILAAVAVAKLSGIKTPAIASVLKSFTGIRHRLQYVDCINGCRYYNDSKATNILAAQKALTAFDDPTVWIAGGLDRGQSFDELFGHLSHVKALVAYGQTADKLVELARSANIPTIVTAHDVQDAVCKAHELASAGDVVLLSPACASWDQYQTFEERGNMFVQAVHKLM